MLLRTSHLLLFATALGLLAGCSDTPAPSFAAPDGGGDPTDAGPEFRACMFPEGEGDVCFEYVGTAYNSSIVESACSTLQNSRPLEECPSATMFSCSFVPDGQTEAERLIAYYDDSTTLQVASEVCAQLQGDFVQHGCFDEFDAPVLSGTVQTRTAYEVALAPYGSTCESEDQSRQCFDGVLSEWTGTFTEDACVVDPGSCQGTAIACGDFTIPNCDQQPGCSTLFTCSSLTPGELLDCASKTEWQCTRRNAVRVACNWDSDMGVCESTGATCEDLDVLALDPSLIDNYCSYPWGDQCEALPALGEVCRGGAAPCPGALDIDTCHERQGCVWQ